MDIAVENVSELTRKVTVTLPAKDVRKALDKSYKKLKKDVKLKWFRRGKIPMAVLEKNFGEQVQGEIGEKLVQETYFDAIEEKGVTGDWRYPNVIRVAPVPQYNSFEDIFEFVKILSTAVQNNQG